MSVSSNNEKDSSAQVHYSPVNYSPVNTSIPHQWPTSPVTLSRALTVKRAFVAVWDGILTLTPLTFIVIAFCALSLDGQAASRFGDNILEAEKLGPTVFPVVFAAIVGRLMTTLARWRAERGSKLGLLEQLNGSQSLFTALERAFLIRRWNWVAISIIILWALSPLGGQSALRLVDIRPSTFADTAPLRYLNTNMTFTDALGANALSPVLPLVQALIQGSLLGASPAVRKSPLDTWGNVKIPMIETLPAYQANSSDNPWLPVNMTHDSNFSYSSLVGIIVSGLPKESNVDSSYFLVESSYVRLECPEWHYVVTSGDLSDAIYDQIGPLSKHTNSTQLANPPGLAPQYWYSRADWILDIQQKDANQSNPNLLFTNLHEPTQKDTDAGGLWTNCSVSTSHVQSNVSCQGSSCAVSQMRRSLTDLRPDDVSLFDASSGGVRALTGVTLLLPNMGSVTAGSTYARDSIKTYLADPDAVILQKMSTEYNQPASKSFVSLGRVSPADFSLRLSQIWNSYLQLIWASTFISGGAPTDVTVYGNQTLPWTAGMDAGMDTAAVGQPPFPNNVSTAYMTREGPKVYASSRVWIALLLIVSILMQGCGIAATVLKYSCRIPHILGHVSSLTRDNPHIPLPPGGTTLDGLERARLLKDMYVQIGDVKEEDEVGHIALKTGISHGIGKDHARAYF